MEAYQAYLRGRYFWNKRDTENLKKAIEQFQQATDKDPGYALAYVGLADSYILLAGNAGYNPGYPASIEYPMAKAFAQRALQIDDSSAEAHTSLAFILAYVNAGQWEWDEAGKEYERAIALNPNYATAHHWYSGYLRDVGRFDEALAESKRAQELDPLSLAINANLANSYLAIGDVNSAIEQGKKVIELEPNYERGHLVLGRGYLKQGRYLEALPELQRAVELSAKSAIIWAMPAMATQFRGSAQKRARSLKNRKAHTPGRKQADMNSQRCMLA